MFPLGNAARATRWVSLGIGAISCGWSDIAILLGSKDGDQTPSLQTLLASGLCEITLRCLMMPHEIGIGPRLMSCKSEFASSIKKRRPYGDEKFLPVGRKLSGRVRVVSGSLAADLLCQYERLNLLLQLGNLV